MPVTIILGVRGEPCNPERLNIIPLEKIVSITSGNQSIVDYQYPLLSFNISMFLQQEEKPKDKAKVLTLLISQYNAIFDKIKLRLLINNVKIAFY